ELQDSESDVAGLSHGRAEAGQALKDANDRVRQLTEIGPQYRELVRERGVIEAAYADVAKRAEDNRLQDTLSRANVRVIQRADPPVKGHTGRLLILAAGLALGLAAAGSSVLWATALSEEMVTPRDVEHKLDLPVVLSVPWRERPAGGRRARIGESVQL